LILIAIVAFKNRAATKKGLLSKNGKRMIYPMPLKCEYRTRRSAYLYQSH
jgi:hypothetical protein